MAEELGVPRSKSFSLTSTGTVLTGLPERRFKIYAYKITTTAPLSLTWRDGSTLLLEGAYDPIKNVTLTEGVSYPSFLFKTSSGNNLDLVVSGSGTVSGRLSYWDEVAP